MKDIPGYEGLYAVTKDGRVLSHVRNKFLSLVKHHTGYYILGLSKNGKRKNMYIHKAMAITYLGKSKLVTNHKNGIKTDNRLVNIELCTVKENNHHAARLGLLNPAKGEKCWKSIFSEKDIIKIRRLFFDEKVPQYKIAKLFETTKSNVIRILTRELWDHLSDGYPRHKPVKGRNQNHYV
jgi:hypothetical protein